MDRSLFLFCRLNTFDLQPHLLGTLVELRPLRPDDWEALFRVASDPLVWQQHPEHDRYKEEVFRKFFQGALASGGAFAVIDRNDGHIIGSTRYCEYSPDRSEIEIGWTFLARSHWGGRYNREMKGLMLQHAYQFVENVVLVVGEHNVRSRKAVERIGGVLIDRRETGEVHGQPVNLVVYQIGKKDFTARKGTDK